MGVGSVLAMHACIKHVHMHLQLLWRSSLLFISSVINIGARQAEFFIGWCEIELQTCASTSGSWLCANAAYRGACRNVGV